jgi:hypothetical protein
MFKKLFFTFFIGFIVFSIYVIKADDVEFNFGEIESLETVIVEDITYRKFVVQTPGVEQHIIHNVELGRYSNFEIVLHDLLYGEDALGLSTVLDIASDYEQKTGKVVYAAFNGDFFSSLPIDFYAVDNNILHIGLYNKNSFGFTKAHKTRVGKVEYGFKINIYDNERNYLDQVHLDKFNQPLEYGEVGVYTSDMSSMISGEDLAIIAVNDNFIPNDSNYHYEGQIKTDLNTVDFSNQNISISQGEYFIVAKGDSASYQKLISIIEQDSVLAVYPYPINDWKGMDFIIGGWQILLDRGNKLPEEIHGSIYSRHPRTTIAVNRDGTIGITVVDGRITNIPGVTLNELADINESLGYYTALELDGGGSSTCLLRNLDSDELMIMNTPADGYLRKVPNAILIVGDKLEGNEPTTTESTTETTTQTTTESTASSEITTFTSDITTSIETTSSQLITTTSQTTETPTSNQIDTTSKEEIVDPKSCSSCNSFGYSTIVFGFFMLIGFLILRRN